MAEHAPTPGPWTAQLHHPVQWGGRTYAMITAAAIVPVAAVVLGVEGCSQEEGRATARAVAAVPDLLNALQNARRYIDAVIVNTPDKKKKRNFGDCLRIIDSALAKASS